MPLEKKAQSNFKITINKEKCKGCGLCVVVCPNNILEISKKSNNIGYFPAQPKKDNACSGCGNCYIICAEPGCIEIYKEK